MRMIVSTAHHGYGQRDARSESGNPVNRVMVMALAFLLYFRRDLPPGFGNPVETGIRRNSLKKRSRLIWTVRVC